MFKKAPAVSLDIKYEPKISRWFIFRFLWAIIIVWPFAVFGIWFGLLAFVHSWYMLLLGERSPGIWNQQMQIIRYYLKWQLYLKFFTNTVPEILP